jgi:hypothetical protein
MAQATIIEKEQGVYTVNGKHVHIDSERRIIALQELTVYEQHAFSSYLTDKGILD